MTDSDQRVKIRGIGILSPLGILHYRDGAGIDVVHLLEKDSPFDLNQGMKVVSNLKIRPTSKEDVELIKHYYLPRGVTAREALDRYVFECSLEATDTPEAIAQTQHMISHIIGSGVLAFRLFKRGYIDSDVVLWAIERRGQVDSSLMVEVHPYCSAPGYRMATYELSELSRLAARTAKIDTEKRKSLRIALDRFSKSYYEDEPEDRLIDYIIAFEALFSNGRRRSQHDVIPVACAMLLGRSEKAREDIIESLDRAYSIRNKIVHGSDYTVDLENSKLDLEELVTEIEDLLRASLRKLI